MFVYKPFLKIDRNHLVIYSYYPSVIILLTAGISAGAQFNLSSSFIGNHSILLCSVKVGNSLFKVHLYVVNLTIPKSYSCSVVMTLSPTIRSHFISSLISLIKASFQFHSFQSYRQEIPTLKANSFLHFSVHKEFCYQKNNSSYYIDYFFIRLTLQIKIILIVILSKITKLYIKAILKLIFYNFLHDISLLHLLHAFSYTSII